VSLPVRKAWKRLSRMSWDEFCTRLGQETSKRAEYAMYRIGVFPSPSRIPARSPAAGRFFFTPDQVPGRLALLKQHLPSAVSETVDQANQILQHRFSLLGYRDLDYGREIDWHLDAVHRRRAPLKPWYKIHFLDFAEVGDHKVIWELNRHQHLVTLAKAWAFTADETYVGELVRQFRSWQIANPYPVGINWGSSLEVGFRSLSWLWVRGLLGKHPLLQSEFDYELVRGLAGNGHYIERYLSTYFSPNTHLIGEAVALFFIGTLCPQIPAARRWQDKGLAIVLAEAKRQVRPDGVYFEQSLYYHVYALDFFLHTRVLAMVNGVAVPPEFDTVLEKMLEVIRVLARNGPPEGFGDDDGGRVFDPRRNRVEHMSDPLAVGATLFESAALIEPARLTEEAVWLFGESAVATMPDNLSPPLSSAAFRDGGLYVIASGSERAVQMLVHAGPQGVARGGHGHADALSVRLSIDKRRWLIDPGSYIYVSPGDERNWFRGTAAHNTMRVDKLDEAVPGNSFSWSSLPEVAVEQWVAGPLFSFFCGGHTGYARLADPAVHQRMIFHLHGEYWLIRDVARGLGVHDLEFFWHFAPDLKLSVSANVLTANSDEQKLVLLNAGLGDCELELDQGPISPAYGEKQMAPVATVKARVQLPAENVTLLLPLGATELPGSFSLAEESASQGAKVYTYEHGEITDRIIFGNSRELWTAGPFRSDALLLWVRSQQRELTALAFCSATLVEMNGDRVFSAASRLERLEWTRATGVSASDSGSPKFFDEEALRSRTPVP
jgi:hypothetical protein